MYEKVPEKPFLLSDNKKIAKQSYFSTCSLFYAVVWEDNEI